MYLYFKSNLCLANHTKAIFIIISPHRYWSRNLPMNTISKVFCLHWSQTWHSYLVSQRKNSDFCDLKSPIEVMATLKSKNQVPAAHCIYFCSAKAVALIKEKFTNFFYLADSQEFLVSVLPSDWRRFGRLWSLNLWRWYHKVVNILIYKDYST